MVRMPSLLLETWLQQDRDMFTIRLQSFVGSVLVDVHTLISNSKVFAAFPPADRIVLVPVVVSTETLLSAIGVWYGMPLRALHRSEVLATLELASFFDDRVMAEEALQYLYDNAAEKVQRLWKALTARVGTVYHRPGLTWVVLKLFSVLYLRWNDATLPPPRGVYWDDWQALKELPFCDCVRHWTGQTSLEAFATVNDIDAGFVDRLLEMRVPGTPHLRHLAKLYDAASMSSWK